MTETAYRVEPGIFIGIFSTQAMIDSRLEKLRKEHKDTLDEIKKQAVSVSESAEKIRTLERTQDEFENRLHHHISRLFSLVRPVSMA